MIITLNVRGSTKEVRRKFLDEFEDWIEYLDEDEHPNEQMIARAMELGLTIETVVKSGSDDCESCGDDGICRTFPGASFWYD